MQIWLDTINLKVIEDAALIGVISGVTTNPSILSMTTNVAETLTKLLELQNGPIAVQVTAKEAEMMIIEARAIFAFTNRAVIKIPLNYEGMIAMRQLRAENIPVLATAIFHPSQVLLAANLGATFVAPYFQHIGDVADAYETLRTMATILQNYETKLLVASLKNLDDLIFCSKLGVPAVTIKEDLYYKLISEHPLLTKFTQIFKSDWNKTHGNVSVDDLLYSMKVNS